MSILLFDGKQIEISDEWSRRDFTMQSLHEAEIRPCIIYQSCFAQEKPDTEVFPPDMLGVTFINCNLDNVKLPVFNEVIGGSQRRISIQNDLRDWEVDEDGQPIKVLNEKEWAAKDLSIDPRDIPAQPLASLEEIKKVEEGFFDRLWGSLWR
jgi:hypothetical protein